MASRSISMRMSLSISFNCVVVMMRTIGGLKGIWKKENDSSLRKGAGDRKLRVTVKVAVQGRVGSLEEDVSLACSVLLRR